MGIRAHSRWRVFVAQAVTLLLVLQTTLGIAACPNRFASADSWASLLCATQPVAATANDDTAPAQQPANDPARDCPICQSFLCHAAVILAPELAVPVPDGTVAFAQDIAPAAWVFTPPALHNRGPPSLLHA